MKLRHEEYKQLAQDHTPSKLNNSNSGNVVLEPALLTHILLISIREKLK